MGESELRAFFVSVGLLFVGAITGWFAHDFVSQSKNIIIEAVQQEESVSQAEKPIKRVVSNEANFTSLNLGQKLLSNPQLDKLIELFKLEMNDSEREQLDRQLIQYAKLLVSEPGKHGDVEKQLLTLSNIDSVQVKVLPLLIAYYKQYKQNQAAINQLYKLRSLQNFDTDFNRIKQQIDNLTAEQVKHFEHTNQKEKLISFYEHMISLEPDNYTLQMQFALFEYDNRHYDNVMRLLSVLVYHPDLEDQALKLLQKTQYQLSRQESGDIPVSVESKNGQYIVSAVINDLEPVRFMLDTGASLTILSPEIINSLGINEAQRSLRFSTANGEVSAPIVLIDKIDIQNYLVRDIEVGVLPSFPMGSIDGLLGMNFLSQFSFFIDQENSVLHLSNIESQ